MPATIQKILKPTKYRAVDTSTSEQIVGEQLLEDPSFNVDVAQPSDNGVAVVGSHWQITDLDIEITGGKAVWTAYSGTGNRELKDRTDGPFLPVTDRYRVTIVVSDYTSGELSFNSGSYNTGYVINSAGTWTFDFSPETGSGNFHIKASNNDGDGTEDAVLSVSEVSVYKLESFNSNNHGQIYSGKGLEFDGVGDYLNTGYVFSSTAHTICAWAKVLNNNSNNKFILDARDANNDGVLLYFNGSEQVGYLVNNTDLIISEKYINEWIRIIATSDGSTQSLYINGQLHSSQSISETISVTSEARIGARNYSTAESFFDGMLSDVQVWDVGFSASDALYDYLNPESLALSNGGTLLAESNLKLWYPMQNGHRGQQSYILDGSGTGSGPELISDISASAWTILDIGGGAADSSTSATDSNGSVIFETAYTSDWQTVSVPFVNENGVTYKISITGEALAHTNSDEDNDDKFYWRVGSNANNGHNTENVNTSWMISEGAHTETNYFKSNVSTGTAYFIGMFKKASDVVHKFRLDSVSIKAVNQKHHATTVFMGDNLYTAANAMRVEADGTTADEVDDKDGWNSNGTSTFTTSTTSHSGSKSIVYEANVNHGGISTDLQPYLTVGRTYKLSLFVRHTTGGTAASDQSLRFSDASNLQSNMTEIAQIEPSDTTFTEVSREFVYDDDKYRYFGAKELNGDGSSGDGGLFMDTMYIKEVGVASGWTDADQQIDIPQTALQSYNQLAMPHGKSTSHVAYSDGDSDLKFTTENHSFSFWICPQSDNNAYVFSKGQYHTSGYYVYWGGSTMKLQYQTHQSSANQTNALDDALTAGKWYHAVVAISNNGTKSQWYINGELENSNSGHTAATADTRNFQIYNRGAGSNNPDFGLTELSVFNKTLTQAEVNELYNDGKALDATTHSASGSLLHYWRNNGLAEWTDIGNAGSLFNGTPTNIEETLLLPAGVDASRDTQGFIMNRQKDTNSLNLSTNLLASGIDDGPHVKVKNVDLDTSDFSVCFWIYKFRDWTDQYIVSQFQHETDRWYIRGNNSTDAVLNIYAKSNGNVVLSDNDTTTLDAAAYLEDWLHVVVTVDRSDTSAGIQWYLNGEASSNKGVESGQTTASLSRLTVADLTIGWNEQSGQDDHHFDGKIDDLLIYNDKLEAAEVKRIYNAGKRGHR